MSVVYLSLHSKANRFYTCQRSNNPKKCNLFEVTFVDNEGFNKCGLWYTPIHITIVNNGETFTQ